MNFFRKNSPAHSRVARRWYSPLSWLALVISLGWLTSATAFAGEASANPRANLIAPFALSPLNPTVDQGGTIGFVYSNGQNCPPQINPTPWTWSVSGGGTLNYGSSDQDTQCVSFRTLVAGYAPGTFTINAPGQSTTFTVNPMVLTLSSGSIVLAQGASTRVTATFSGVADNGGYNTQLNWTLSTASGGTIQPDLPAIPGDGTVTVTAGSVPGTYTLTAQSAQEPAVSASAAVTVLPPPPPPTISMSPTNPIVGAGQPLVFAANVQNTTDQNVFLTTDDGYAEVTALGANSGTFLHPASAPGGQWLVTALSELGPVTWTTVTVVSVAVTPATVIVPPGTSRQFAALLVESQQAIEWSTNIPGAAVSSVGLLQVPASAPLGNYTVTAQTVGNPLTSATSAVTVARTIPVSGVVVSPAASVLASGQDEPLAAVVLGQNSEPNPNQAVLWSVAGPAPAAVAGNGLFVAPSSAGVYTVTATSQADSTKSGNAVVRVGEDLVITPASASLAAGASQTFVAQVSGVANPNVIWTVSEGAAGGTISAAGVYVAPATAGIYHVMATSSASGESVSDVATVTVESAPNRSIHLSPTEVSVNPGASLVFAAAVQGLSDTGIVWSASAGTIDQTGVFTAPSTYGAVTVTATSHADGTVQASSTVVVTSPSGSVTFRYDANGNVVFDGIRTFEWDGENRLTAITVGTHRTEMGYDSAGRRVMIIEKDNGSVTSKRHYVWVGDEIAEERDATFTPATIPQSLAAMDRPTTALANHGENAANAAASPVDQQAAPAASGANATFVSQTGPTSLVAGGVYRVSVTLLNSGSTTWTAATKYRLGSSNPQDNSTWGVTRVYLAASDAIAPGQQKVFTWNVTAPATPGTYNFQWQLLQEGVAWIGDLTPNQSVSVVAGATANLAQMISQVVPTRMTAGGIYTVSLTFQNAGTNTWTPASNHRLGAQNPQDNSTWGFARVFMAAGDSIAQGQLKTFTFTVRAPATSGSYNFQWRMVQDGVGWFGDGSPNVAVTVVSGATANLSEFISQVVPATMAAGVTYQVSVTIGNAGTNTWTPASNHHLGSQNLQDNSTWGLSRVFLNAGDNIGQGQVKTFNFAVTAPTTPGAYNFQWQMVQEGVGWFGDFSPNTAVIVVTPAEPVLTRFFPGGMQAGGSNYYFSFDHLGSIREVTDSTGAVVSRYDYDAYGRLTINQGDPPRFGYAGYYYHAPSGLSFTKYRAYDPDLGRWESRDPAEFAGGLNLYSYVENDPSDSLDPLGLKKTPCRDPFKPIPKPRHPTPGPNPTLCPGYPMGQCPSPASPTPVPTQPPTPPPLPVWLQWPDPFTPVPPAPYCFGQDPCETLLPTCRNCIRPGDNDRPEPPHGCEGKGCSAGPPIEPVVIGPPAPRWPNPWEETEPPGR